ncbi:MAG: glycosyltransferase, partial [Ignavibacteria bacterium]|nr:glycosyltransferase [Ignavibacteria bacterium]
PCVYDAHELFTEVPEVIDRPSVRKIWLRVEKFICRRIKYAYTVSASVAEEFKKGYGTDFSLIRNLPNRKIINHPSKTATENLIIYRGAVNKGRGLKELIEAMKSIDAKLLIAGDGDLTDELKQQVNESGLKNKISFTGYQTPQQLDEQTLNAKIGVNLLESVSKNYYYSLANKFLDYIQCEVPQLCMNFPEYEKVNAEYKIATLIDTLNPDLISKAINTLIKDKNLYNELKVNCARCAAELCWEEEEKKLIDFYKNI